MMTYDENSCEIFSTNEAFFFDKENGQLLQVQLVETVFERDSKSSETVYATTSAKVVNSGELITIDETEVYASRLDFEKGKRLACSTNNPFKCLAASYGSDVFWTFQHGCPVSQKVSDIKVVKYDYDYDRFTSTELPDREHIYPTKEECLSYNEYEIVDEEGTRTIKGCNALLQLTDKQKELVEQFEQLCKKMDDEGILLASNCCEAFRAYNVKDCADYEFYFTNEASEDFEQCDRDCGRYVNAQNIYESGDDFELYIKRK